MFHSDTSQRYGKAKGMKVKHLVQLVALTVLFIWVLYQVKSLHKARVISRRAEKAENLDDDLLITVGKSAADLLADKVVERNAEVANEDLIDVQKESRPLDISELDLFSEEVDRMDVTNKDSTAGDGDESSNSEEDSVKRDEDTEIENQGKFEDVMEEPESHREVPVATTEDQGDFEDEAEGTVENEFDAHQDKSGTFATIISEDVQDNTKEVPAQKSSEWFDSDEVEDLRPDDFDSLQESTETKTEDATGDKPWGINSNEGDLDDKLILAAETFSETEVNFTQLGFNDELDKSSNDTDQVSREESSLGLDGIRASSPKNGSGSPTQLSNTDFLADTKTREAAEVDVSNTDSSVDDIERANVSANDIAGRNVSDDTARRNVSLDGIEGTIIFDNSSAETNVSGGDIAATIAELDDMTLKSSKDGEHASNLRVDGDGDASNLDDEGEHATAHSLDKAHLEASNDRASEEKLEQTSESMK